MADARTWPVRRLKYLATVNDEAMAEGIFARFMNERDFQNRVSEWISRKVYVRFRSKPDA